MTEQAIIAVDAMGGDRGPETVFAGITQALNADPALTVIVCGDKALVEPYCASQERAEACPTTEVIAMDEHPATAVRKKKDSSIVVGCRLVREGRAQGFFSAGSTGACLAAATLVMGRLKGVKRPALAQVLPAYEHPVLLLDVGANADCKPEYLVQFARMGCAYMQGVMGVAHPSVGLLNIGEEDTKGSMEVQEAHKLLRAELPEFKGNAEGRDLLSGGFDVIVTDGFTGNVCLKTIEGTSKTLFSYVKDALKSSVVTSLGALLIKGKLAVMKDKLSPDAYGGTPLLGVKGACIIGHGSSNERAVANGIAVAAETVRSSVAQVIASSVEDSAASAPNAASSETSQVGDQH